MSIVENKYSKNFIDLLNMLHTISTHTMKIFILYLFLLSLFLGLTVFFFADIETVIDDKKFKESFPTNPEYRIFIEPTHDFKCPPSTPYFSDYNIHASFLQQAGQILSYGGTLF